MLAYELLNPSITYIYYILFENADALENRKKILDDGNKEFHSKHADETQIFKVTD